MIFLIFNLEEAPVWAVVDEMEARIVTWLTQTLVRIQSLEHWWESNPSNIGENPIPRTLVRIQSPKNLRVQGELGPKIRPKGIVDAHK